MDVKLYQLVLFVEHLIRTKEYFVKIIRYDRIEKIIVPKVDMQY